MMYETLAAGEMIEDIVSKSSTSQRTCTSRSLLTLTMCLVIERPTRRGNIRNALVYVAERESSKYTPSVHSGSRTRAFLAFSNVRHETATTT